jgi:hypothetical protein
MSLSDLSGEELLVSIESHFKEKMPDECLNAFKRYTLCKYERNEEIKKTKGLEYFKDYSTEPFARVEGCKNEYYNYHNCYFEFYYRYLDMKNYVAELQGNKPVFDINEEEKKIKIKNIGLNKF